MKKFLVSICALLLMSCVATVASAHEEDTQQLPEISADTDPKGAPIPAMPDPPLESDAAVTAGADLFAAIPPEMREPSGFYLAEVTRIVEEGEDSSSGETYPYQVVEVILKNGPDQGQIFSIEYGHSTAITNEQKVKLGDTIVVANVGAPGNSAYYIFDKYRLNPLMAIAALFFFLVIFFGRKKGFGSILGLGASIIVLAFFIVPQILAGGNPLVTSLIGACVIATISIFLAHGFTKQTALSYISTVITLAISSVLSIIFVDLTNLSGTGSDEIFYLQGGGLGQINFKGLLLGGIIIGALGVLDDVTTSQTAAVAEIHRANNRLHFKELYDRGLKVGREHIASLVNTLVLAYAGASFPLFLIFSTDNTIPLWASFNSEFVVEEAIRTLVGSTALVLAVPISTLLAAHYFSKHARNISV